MAEKHKEPEHPVKAKNSAAGKKPHLEDAEQDYKHLLERMQKLNEFMVTGEFAGNADTVKELYYKQHDLMDQLLAVLQHRIQLHNEENKSG